MGADRRAEAVRAAELVGLGSGQHRDRRREAVQGPRPHPDHGPRELSPLWMLLGLDLVADPKRAAVPDVAFRIAGAFWFNNGLNELADLATDDAFRRITKRINGGVNGLAERRRFYAQARTVLGVVVTPITRGRARPLPAPGTTAEPVFERGAEAIRARVRRASTRKAASVTRKTKTRPAATQRRGQSPALGERCARLPPPRGGARPRPRRSAESPQLRSLHDGSLGRDFLGTLEIFRLVHWLRRWPACFYQTRRAFKTHTGTRRERCRRTRTPRSVRAHSRHTVSFEPGN